jgi:16S rRNA (uracil1498-N3)-methyltransferase
MKIRIYTPNTLLLHNTVLLNDEQTHYITKVMRLGTNDEILLFNKQCGEFLCIIKEISKKHSVCSVIKKTKDFQEPQIHITCVFSVIKPKNIELIIQKCTEIGVKSFIPLKTIRTNDFKLNIERLQKIATEAT